MDKLRLFSQEVLSKYNEDSKWRFYLNLLMITAINTVFIILYVKFIKVYYSINDDTAISGLITGIQGQHPGYSVYINFIPSYIMSKLTLIQPSINWYGVYLMGTFYSAFIIIGTILIDKMKARIGFAMYSIIAICGILPFLEEFTFTLVCYISILAAICTIVYGYENEVKNIKNFCYIIGGIFLINSSFIRFNSIYTGMLLIVGYIIVKSIKDKKKVLILVMICLITGTCAFALRRFSRNQYYKEADWKNYLEFNTARSNLIDYGLPEYNEHEDFYISVGWSENDFNIFNSYSFPEEEKFSTENLRKINDYKESIESNNKLEVKYVIEKIYNIMMTSISTIICIVLILVIGIYNIFYGKEKFMSILLMIFPYGIHIGFILMNRAPYRVVYPHYFIALVLLILISNGENDVVSNSDEDDKRNNKIINCISSMALICFIFLGGNILIKHYENTKYIKNNEFLRASVEVNDTLANDKENLYLTSLNSNGSIVKGKNIFRGYLPDSKTNVVSVGGWLSRTKNILEFKERNNIENLIYDLIEKDNYYFVDIGSHVGLFTIYFKETYGLDVSFEIVNQMYHTNIYKVRIIDTVIENEQEDVDSSI